MVTEDEFINATGARSTRRDQPKIPNILEEVDIRLKLHACEAVDSGYELMLVISRDTDVLLLLVQLMSVVQLWMIAGTAQKRKCYPVHNL